MNEKDERYTKRQFLSEESDLLSEQIHQWHIIYCDRLNLSIYIKIYDSFVETHVVVDSGLKSNNMQMY